MTRERSARKKPAVGIKQKSHRYRLSFAQVSERARHRIYIAEDIARRHIG